ncbi:MAG: hypothetical protein J6R13_00890 [Alistipes sp.]|nr:hypothetical protein [Alistipes sp.]MBO7195072.1 hypothetical protein [Alistipes sp.]
MNIRQLVILLSVVILPAMGMAQTPKEKNYVIVKVKCDGKSDVSDAIQKIIDNNPNRTIYFPDGVYPISKPICTPADPKKSVSLELSNYAIIKAMDGWNSEEAMIRLGGKDPFNTVYVPGSNYYLDGGIIDGSGVAKGVSIDSGRETVIRNTSIKHVTLGIHIKRGANSGSSDADIHSVNIVGNCTPASVGVLVEGYDNTFTNMRIGGVHVGFHIRTGANCLRNIHPLYYGKNENYETSCGFIDERHTNFYDFCYSDEFCTAFLMRGGGHSTYSNCFAYWYSKRGDKHVAFKSEGDFNSDVMSLNIGFGKHNATKENKVLESTTKTGVGKFFNLHVDDYRFITDHSHLQYME